MAKENNLTLGAGDVAIMLDGEERVLRLSIGAFKAIDKAFGGIVAATQQIGQYSPSAIEKVITIGLGLTPNGAKGLDDKIFATGIADDSGRLAALCQDYLLNIARGPAYFAKQANEEASQDTADPQ